MEVLLMVVCSSRPADTLQAGLYTVANEWLHCLHFSHCLLLSVWLILKRTDLKGKFMLSEVWALSTVRRACVVRSFALLQGLSKAKKTTCSPFRGFNMFGRYCVGTVAVNNNSAERQRGCCAVTD